MPYPNYNYPAFGNYNPVTPFSPANSYQQINNQNLPTQPIIPQNSQPVQPHPNVICRPVASEEEARAVPTDFSGAMLVMTDIAHGKIYTKSLNYADGSAIFQVYNQSPQQNLQPENSNNKKEEFAPLSLVQQVDDLKNEIEALKSELEKYKKPSNKSAGKVVVAE